MNHKRNSWLRPARTRGRAVALAKVLSLALAVSGGASAQGDDAIRDAYPDLANLFNAFDTTHAAALDAIAAVNGDPETMDARMELAMHLDMMANITMREMMAMGGHSAGEVAMNMSMDSQTPYGERETDIRVGLQEQLRQQHDPAEASSSFQNSEALDSRTAEIFERGRRFENQLFAIFIDDAVVDKQAAVAAAAAEYLSDETHSVSSEPKNVGLLLDHPQATALQTGFPLLRGFLWSNQWLQLAALEAVVLETVDENAGGGVATALERYWNKMGSAGGMTMFPAPVELPMAPAIAPNLYSQSTQAAIILDNLNVLETIVADILAWPNLDNRAELIAAAARDFTDKSTATIDNMSYLLFALRGGIYNQGGPAVGELMQSERNRSRSAMDMRHAMIMSQPM